MQATMQRTSVKAAASKQVPAAAVRAAISPLAAQPVAAQAVCAPSARVSRVHHLAQVLTRRRLATALSATATAAESNGVQAKTSTPLPIVFVSAECSPWSKTGGLGDVVGGLPIELVKRGHQVLTIAPRYDQYSDAWDTSVVINIDGEDVRFFHTFKQGVHRVWVDHPWFLAKVWGKTGAKLYGPKSGADFVDNHKRFSLFCKAAIEAARVLPFGTGEDCVFVANDWHSALVPVLLKDVYQAKGQFKKAKAALCIHNIAFQGRMWPETFKDMGLPESSMDKLSFTDGYSKVFTEHDPLDDDDGASAARMGSFKKLNWLKAGILAADKVLTVSPHYAKEIAQDASGGVELDGVIRAKGGATGIVNGMDTEEWDPRMDKFLTIKYNKTNVYEGKAAAKEVLQAEVGLPVTPGAPLFAFIGRLEEQKGVDILLAAVPKILAKVPNAQIVILGTGKAKFEKSVQELNKSLKGNYKGVVKFSAPLAHLITAGADFIMVPSRFEPCGLIQLHAMQYGTVPVVASTGGLVDTVKEGVTGFHMGAMDKDALVSEDVDAVVSTAERAAQAFSTGLYKQMVYNAISQDLSWAKPAQKWEGVLEELFLGLGSGRAKAEEVKIPIAEAIPGPVAATDKPLSAAALRKASAPASVSNGVATSAAPSAPRTTFAPSTFPRPAGAPTGAPTTAAPKVATAPAAPASSNGASNGATKTGTATPSTTGPATLTPKPRSAKTLVSARSTKQ